MIEPREIKEHVFFKNIQATIWPVSNLRKWLSLGFGILLIVWLSAQVDLSSAVDIFREISIPNLVIGFVLYLVSFYLRAARFKILLPADIPLRELFPIVLVHYTALNIIPARLGELSYVYLLNKHNHVSTGTSVSSLLLARVFDLLALTAIFFTTLNFLPLPAPWLRTISIIAAGFLLAAIGVLFLILMYKEKCLRWFQAAIEKMRWDRYKLIQSISKESENVVRSFRHIESWMQAGKAFAVSLGIWLSILGINYVVLQAFGAGLSYIKVVVGGTLIILLTIIPVDLFSGFGVRSMSWKVLFEALGASRDVAIVSAFGSKVVTTFYLFLLGAYGLWKVSKKHEDLS